MDQKVMFQNTYCQPVIISPTISCWVTTKPIQTNIAGVDEQAHYSKAIDQKVSFKYLLSTSDYIPTISCWDKQWLTIKLFKQIQTNIAGVDVH